MEPTDLTIHLLTEIRDEIRSTKHELGARIDRTNERLDHVNRDLGARIDETNRRLDENTTRITEFEVRVTTALVDVATSVNDVHSLLRDRLDLRGRVERCEQDIDDLKRRVY